MEASWKHNENKAATPSRLAPKMGKFQAKEIPNRFHFKHDNNSCVENCFNFIRICVCNDEKPS